MFGMVKCQAQWCALQSLSRETAERERPRDFLASQSIVSYSVSSRSAEDPDSNDDAKQNKRNKSSWHLRDDTQGCLLLASMCTRTCTHDCFPHNVIIHKYIYPTTPKIIKRKKKQGICDKNVGNINMYIYLCVVCLCVCVCMHVCFL